MLRCWFFGRPAERCRRNQTFIFWIALFTAASAAFAAARSVESLVTFWVIQAAGAALMTPTFVDPALFRIRQFTGAALEQP